MSTEEKKASQIILERMDKMETSLKTLIESQKPQATESQPAPTPKENEEQAKPSHDSVESMLNCPECGKKARETVLAPLHGQKIVKCKKCGTHVGEKTEKCPSCGNSEAE